MIGTALLSYLACAWSALTYAATGMPKDKASYWARSLGFGDPAPNLLASWAAYRQEGGFHRLKDVGVEWTKVWPQRAFKLLALFGCLLFLLGLLLGGAITWAL